MGLLAWPAAGLPSTASAGPSILDSRGRPIESSAATRLSVAGVNAGPTTLDGRAQQLADAALAETLREVRPQAKGGALVVIDLAARSLVAVASAPELDRMRAGESLPPGSVLKPFVAASLLESGVADGDRRYPCPARITLAGAALRNWQRIDREPLSLERAIAHSCNTVFYQLASSAWTRSRFERPLREWGFGAKTGLLPREDTGYLPDARSERELLSMAIGQGGVLASPLQVATAFASIATGEQMTLRTIDGSNERHSGRTGSAGALRVVLSGMRAAATEGTAARAMNGLPLEIAAKTGTAEIGFRPTAWFAAIVPVPDPRFVIVAAFEEGGFGADAAAPAVRRVVEGLFGLPPERSRFVDLRLGAILVAAIGVALFHTFRLRRRSKRFLSTRRQEAAPDALK